MRVVLHMLIVAGWDAVCLYVASLLSYILERNQRPLRYRYSPLLPAPVFDVE